MSSIFDDEFGDKVQPRDGFVYPASGDVVTTVNDFRTPAGTIIKAGEKGTVLDNRKPGTFDEVHGYMGLVVHFDCDKKTYSGGMVVRWDKASDPEIFSIAPPDAETLAERARVEAEKLEAAKKWREYDEFGAKTFPRGGFIYPQAGEKIIALEDFETSASKGERFIRKGDVGEILGNREPGQGETGYIGLIVKFDRVAKSYPGGLVIRWDKASDRKRFSIPASEEKEVIRAEEIYTAAQSGAAAPIAISRPLKLKPAGT